MEPTHPGPTRDAPDHDGSPGPSDGWRLGVGARGRAASPRGRCRPHPHQHLHHAGRRGRRPGARTPARVARARARRRRSAVPLLRRSAGLRPDRHRIGVHRELACDPGLLRTLGPCRLDPGRPQRAPPRAVARRRPLPPPRRRRTRAPRRGDGRQPHVDAEGTRAVRRGRGASVATCQASSSACTAPTRARAPARHGASATPTRSTSRSNPPGWGRGSPSPATAATPSRSCGRSTSWCCPTNPSPSAGSRSRRWRRGHVSSPPTPTRCASSSTTAGPGCSSLPVMRWLWPTR